MGLPHFSQTSPLYFSFNSSTSFAVRSFSSLLLPLVAPGKGLVFLQSGYPEQARNLPKRPSLISMGLPHLSQTSFVSSVVSSFFESVCSFSVSVFLKGS